MAFMIWTEDFNTGLEIVDRQHHRLMEMINEVAPLLLTCDPAMDEQRQSLFAALVDYTGYHFRTEEELMREKRLDPRVYEHHCATHAHLVKDILDWENRFSCSAPLTGQQLLSFLASWLLFHVLGEDQTMARQVRAIEAGLSPERAYIEAEGARLAPTDDILSRTITGLYNQLSAQIREISLQNNHLEEQVEARTGELVAMASDLRQARDAAESASRAKSRFLAMVSHELRTPMNAIAGFTATLRSQRLSPEQDALAARVTAAAQKLSGLIDGLIEYSSNDVEASAPFNLRTILTESCEGPFAAAKAKGIAVSLDIQPGLPAVFSGDSYRISLVIRQLAANAAKFTSKGRIRVRAEAKGAAQDGRIVLRLSVADTGPGIPEDQKPGLFEPFHQLDDSATRRYGGVGLGLALTQQAAQMMGGEIGLESHPGKGSLFWLDVALRPAQTAEDTTARIKSAADKPAEARGSARQAADSDILDRLADLLRQADTRAGQLLMDEADGLRLSLGERFDTLVRQVDDFEYDLALQTMREHH